MRSEFSHNVITLMTGSTLSQAIPIAISPILTRMYKPEDFGLYAIFVAIITIIGTIISGRYELAILLPERDEDAINIFALGILITLIMTSLTMIAVIVFNENIIFWLDNQALKNWLYLVPASIFLAGCHNLLIYFNNRYKQYKALTTSYILKSSTSACIQLLIGYIKQGPAGLISGQLFSRFVVDVQLSIIIIKKKNILSKITLMKIKEVAKRYKDFPKYSVLAILANKMSYQLINIIISTVYSIGTLGLYSHVQRVLGLPSSLISASLGRVFFYEANKEKQRTGKAIKTLKATMKKLVLIGVPIFGILFITVENLFAFIFGEPWRLAGVYAQIVIPFFFVQFVVSALTSIEAIMEKQNIDLLFNILLLFISIIVIFFSLSFSFKIFLINWTISMVAIYSIYAYVLIRMAMGKI
jgi:O-antigen/teichoic acid export membrane protein